MDLERKKEWALRDIVPIVKAVPDAKFLILNIANSAVLSADDTSLFRKANVLMDTSGRALVNLGELLQTYGREKFAFGTHAPMLDDVTGLLRIESLKDSEADATTKEMLRSGNVKEFMHL